MEKEIDIRALLMDKLIPDYEVADCNSFRDNSKDDEGIFGEQLVFRNFNEEMWWSKARQTSFIESIFMGFELPLIVVFEISQNPIKYLVVDGLNRIRTIQNFLNDELRLVPKSIKKAKFLENKTIFEIIAKKNKQVSFTDLLCLYYLIGDINQADLINNSSNIYEIVFEFFESSLNNKLKRSDKISNVGKYKDRLSFFTARTIEINYFKDKLTDLILE